MPKTWGDAQQYCREHYTDLVTVWSEEVMLQLTRPSTFTGNAWIGLFDDPASWKGVMGNDSNSWRWSATGNTSTSQYQNWAAAEPTYTTGSEECVRMSAGRWVDFSCATAHSFVCFTGLPEPGFKNYTFVLTKMSWDDAQSYCRELHTDLAMIEDETENAAMASIVGLSIAWIGLYREPWRWSDGSDTNFTNWMPDQPNNLQTIQHCVTEADDHGWNDLDCSMMYPFHCHRAVDGKIQIMSMKLQSEADLSQPDLWSQLPEKIKEELLRMGISDLKVRWKNPPKGGAKGASGAEAPLKIRRKNEREEEEREKNKTSYRQDREGKVRKKERKKEE
ncbi:hypothetical protein WMY93_026956 [Mugilogobius chulae]|uniref:C-type lectin domain-containing protein n=1 Tax=Mugilogobius chulae TaxID=88201 RepID=A0AAW0N1S8_9GOBI